MILPVYYCQLIFISLQVYRKYVIPFFFFLFRFLFNFYCRLHCPVQKYQQQIINKFQAPSSSSLLCRTPLPHIFLHTSLIFLVLTILTYTFLETTITGHFSDNGVVLFPNTPMTIEFYSQDPVTINNLSATLSVRSLISAYQQ